MQQSAASGHFTYQRHEPEDSVLYQIVQENLETFLRLVQEETGYPLPDFVEKEFRDYLKCGLLVYGFLRVQCETCLHEKLVAYSCKKRGFCPSCGGRRMSETAIHLVDYVLPVKPIRQWVLSFPIQLRLLLAIRPKLMADVLHITNLCISNYLRKKAGLAKSKAKTGSWAPLQEGNPAHLSSSASAVQPAISMSISTNSTLMVCMNSTPITSPQSFTPHRNPPARNWGWYWRKSSSASRRCSSAVE